MHDYSNFEDKAPASNILHAIALKAREQREAQELVDKAEEALELAKARFKRIAEVELPELMEAAQQRKLTTIDGFEVVLEEKIRGSIPKGKEEPAFAWLEKHGHDNLIKREFKIEFGKDEEAWAAKFQRDLAQRKKPLKVEVKRTVHPSTLASFLKEVLEAGEAVPLTTFGCYQQKVTKINLKD